MTDSEYLISIVARLRDEASQGLRDLQRQVEQLKASAAGRNATSDLERGFDDLGDSAGDSADEIERHNAETERLRNTSRTTRSAIDETAKAHDRAADAAGRHTDATSDAADAQSDLIDEARRGQSTFRNTSAETDKAAASAATFEKRLQAVEAAESRVHQRFQSDNADLQKYADSLNRVSQAYGTLARQSELGSKTSDDMLARQRAVHTESSRLGSQASGSDLASSYSAFKDAASKGSLSLDESKRGFKNYATDFAQVSRAFDTGSESAREYGRMADEAKSQLAALSDTSKDLTTRTTELDQAQQTVYARFESGRSSIRGLADDLRRVQQQYASLAREAPIGSDLGADLISKSRSAGRDASQYAAHATGGDLVSSYRDFDSAVKSGSVSTSEAQRGYQSFASDFTKVSRAFDDGSFAAREFGKMADDAGKKLDNIPLAQSGNAFEAFAARAGSATDLIHVRIVKLSAALHGLGIISVVGLFQDIDTAVVGLAGSLFALASDAAEAGAALGGALVSGLAQAIPVTGVLLAGIERVKSVLDAVKLSQQVQQEASFDPTQDASTQLSTSEALTSAQDSLVDAYNNVTEAQERVTESQEQLTQARIDAIRNITDLTLAEKTATEQATGARLSLTQAEQALQQLQQTGGTTLQVQQAELAVQEARTGVTQANIAVPRARADAARARRQRVSGNLEVMSASDEARQARLDLQRANQAVPQSRAQLKLAQMQAASPSGSETSEQGQLNYLKQQMSQPELVLFNALDSLENQLKQKGSPLQKIGDDIVEPIAGALNRVKGLLDDPTFVTHFEKLGDAVKKGLNVLLNPKGGKGFLEQMADDAAANAPKITGILSAIESLFMSLATAAAPELHKLLSDLDTFLTRLAGIESSAGGQDHLTAEFDLWGDRLERLVGTIRAFHGLLKALGEDAAPAGDNALTGLTGSMDQATAWVQDHGPEVRKFFSDCIDVVKTLGDLLGGIGKVLLAVFNLDSLQTFTTFANQVLLPAITLISKAIGGLVTGILDFFNLLPGGRDLLVGIVAAFTGLLVVNKVANAFLVTTRAVRGLWDAMKVFSATGSYTAAFKAFAAQMDGVRTSAQNATTPLQTFGTAGKTAGVEVGEGMTAAETAVTGAKTKLTTDAAADGTAIEEGFLIAPTVGKNIDAGMTEAETEVVAAKPTLAADGTADGAAIGSSMLKAIPTVFTVAALVLIFHKQITDAMQKVATAIFGGVAPGGPGAKSVIPGGTVHYDANGNPVYANVPTRNIGGPGPVGGVNQGMQAVGDVDDKVISNPGSSPNRAEFAQSLLKQIGAPTTAANINAIVAWESAENTRAAYNPLAITVAPHQLSGVQGDLGSDPNQNNGDPVKNIATAQGGILDTSLFLQKNTPAIVAALQSGKITPAQLSALVTANHWGTEPFGGAPASANAVPVGDVDTGTGAQGPMSSIAPSSGAGSPTSTSGQSPATANRVTTAIEQLAASAKTNKSADSTLSAGLAKSGSSIGGLPNTIALNHALGALPTFVGVDPSNAINLIAQSFTALKKGFGFLNTTSAKMAPVATQVNDFITFSSQAVDQTYAAMDAALQQLQTRLSTKAIRAQFSLASNGSWQSLQSRPAGIGGVISRGVGAGDQANIAQYENVEQSLSNRVGFATTALNKNEQERSQDKLVTNAAKRQSLLKQINATIAGLQSKLTDKRNQLATNLQNEYQAEQQAVQDELTAVANTYQTQQAFLTGKQSGLQALGNYTQLPAVDQALVTSTTNNVAALQDALHKAAAEGDSTTVATIKQQIAQLKESITEYTAEQINDAVSAVQSQAQTDSARTQMYSGLASVATTQGNFSLAGTLSAQSYQSAISSDTNQVSAYAGPGANLTQIAGGNYSSVAVNSILGQALATGNQGAVATIVQALDGVGSDLATNTQALTDNTAATNDAAASYTQARGQFQSSVYGGLAQIVQTIGQTTGYTDVPTLQKLYEGGNNSLTGANNSLAATLAQDFGVNVQGQNPQQMVSSLMGLNLPGMEAGMDPAQAQEFEDLINSIVTNTEAITANNLQLAQLNGQLTQPQSFNSSLWTNFRDAIFTGMGGLQPAYASSLGVSMAANPAFTGTGIAGSSTTTHINVSSNPVLPEVDPYTQGRAIAFALKTPQ